MSKEVEMAGGGEAAGIEPLPECSLRNVTVIMTRGMENAFFRWGYRIAKYPWYVRTPVSNLSPFLKSHLLRGKMKCRVRFGNCFLSLVPCCQGKLGEITKKAHKPYCTVHFVS